MAAPDWVSYVGAGTGVLGTGLGFINYWRTAKHKALDLRVELRKLASDTDHDLAHLTGLIPAADRSRINIRAAEGLSRSGAMETWKADVRTDAARVGELRRELSYPTDYSAMSTPQLETELARVHRLRGEVQRLIDKYERSMSADARDVDRRRTIMESRFPSA